MAVTLEDSARELRMESILSDLQESLAISNIDWNSWERKFIQDVSWKNPNELTQAQADKVRELWEKI